MMNSRGNQKLAGAAGVFHFDFRGKTVLDIGSSTGGFTEFALAAGADRVIAVEKGVRQMKAPLRFDPRVELHEKTDIFEVAAETYVKKKVGVEARHGSDMEANEEVIIPVPDVILADVSFMPLEPILEYARKWLAGPKTEFLVMLKPQFEAKEKQLNRGVVKNEKMRREIIREFEAWLRKTGFVILDKRDNELKGKHGNVERFYLLKYSHASA